MKKIYGDGEGMYSYNNKMKYKQMLFVFISLVAAILVAQIFLRVLFFIFVVLMARDLLKVSKTAFKVLPDRIQVFVGEQMEKEVMYKDLEFITLTRKNKNWVVLVTKDGNVTKLTRDIINFDVLIKEILNYTKSNKKIEVHEQILSQYK